jgi:hypothetical protein
MPRLGSSKAVVEDARVVVNETLTPGTCLAAHSHP